ncbi:MAG: calcium-binding protein [Sedimentitalea sp.]
MLVEQSEIYGAKLPELSVWPIFGRYFLTGHSLLDPTPGISLDYSPNSAPFWIAPENPVTLHDSFQPVPPKTQDHIYLSSLDWHFTDINYAKIKVGTETTTLVYGTNAKDPGNFRHFFEAYLLDGPDPSKVLQPAIDAAYAEAESYFQTEQNELNRPEFYEKIKGILLTHFQPLFEPMADQPDLGADKFDAHSALISDTFKFKNINQRYDRADDTIEGSRHYDMILAGGGHDHVRSGAGDDLIEGQNGRDVIFAGSGDDNVFGGRGGDEIHGGAGDDNISARGYGNRDETHVHGQTERLFGGRGDDYLLGGADRTLMVGGAGDDHFASFSGNDRIISGDGRDAFYFQFDSTVPGHDIIVGFQLAPKFRAIESDFLLYDTALAYDIRDFTDHYNAVQYGKNLHIEVGQYSLILKDISRADFLDLSEFDSPFLLL